jgi:hypothetical protein
MIELEINDKDKTEAFPETGRLFCFHRMTDSYRFLDSSDFGLPASDQKTLVVKIVITQKNEL